MKTGESARGVVAMQARARCAYVSAFEGVICGGLWLLKFVVLFLEIVRSFRQLSAALELSLCLGIACGASRSPPRES